MAMFLASIAGRVFAQLLSGFRVVILAHEFVNYHILCNFALRRLNYGKGAFLHALRARSHG
ncbi:hypothetical protein CH330_09825 [candidate division WOR-3 bacterium JGI_Cruoil_03_51_56]|uniref:Uncharacterized protein n=1 Tax=candidate division WOR-3 bacterium JGI_Cruoil_03_51_56 TaxID=1973747 RepID=A0A235BP33_UNCW3|nr:MAG: hypothetical protein CH330_09825 [candidate division WOR-3 bacterium JGI_Cruoil_03_51_56]